MKKLRHSQLRQWPRVPQCSHYQSQAWSLELSDSPELGKAEEESKQSVLPAVIERPEGP